MKRMDPALPFYYHTSAHKRFYEGELPDFSKTPAKVSSSRLPQREMIASKVTRRASQPVRSSLTIRSKFHNVPVNMPPLPTANISSIINSEHSYV